MNIRQIEAFLWIARLGNFAAAAERLHITQPTISLRVKELEAQLGVALFDRSGRRARLTDRGRGLIPYAEQMMALDQTIRRQIGDPTVLTGTVRVGVAELVALTWLPALVAQLNKRHPGITVALDIDLTAALWRKFEERTLDVVLLPGPIERPRSRSVYLGGAPFAWMASPALQVPERLLGPADIASWPIILLSTQSNLYAITERWFHEAGAQLSRVALCNNLHTIASLTLQGLGISTLPPALYEAEIAAGKLRTLRTDPGLPAVEYWAVYPADAAATLAAVVADFAGECTTFQPIGGRSLDRGLKPLTGTAGSSDER
ncbi:LysR family transcriptional regulator [Microbaculum marinisediminis]|uniref:LysR family transcriptional regulator n=1 Tax=Microbaculum marinisediminis TaxID=2931392 RepID=A0AAW5R412_9HYPH|nr:LysR family transcriptional regulator [Microbaculum sp. A6E488]MCT8973354.1 LysR family transcriptional regulator [Microbaculum sp. A6E488]